MSSNSWRNCCLLAILCAGFGSGCGESDSRPSATRGVLLISIDTLRADHLGYHGYDRDTSPFVDSLAQRGVIFDNAYVQLPGTLPSHMSIFTGLYPGEHGVYPPAGVLSPEIETLPEAFLRSGYRTAGFTEGGYVHGGYGFDRGFEEFSHEARKLETDVERTLERGLAFLRGLEEDERFFLFLHTYVVHDPYFPPDEYLERFWPGPKPEAFRATGRNFAAFNRGENTITPEALEFYRASYDASIRYADDVLKSFFAELSQLGLDRDLTVVFTSDHGEEFLEHGRMAHGQIYRETLHVPLFFLHPALEARRAASVVQSIDIAPTLYEIAGIAPRTRASGRSLIPLLSGHQVADLEAYSENFNRRRRSLVVRQGDRLYQLIHWIGRSSASKSKAPELYDLSADPRGSNNLARKRPAIVDNGILRLEGYDHRPRSSVEERDLDPELEERLKALGYLQ